MSMTDRKRKIGYRLKILKLSSFALLSLMPWSRCFSMSGLFTLIGIVIFISGVTEEAGNKPKSTMDELKFNYQYGPSFAMTISSFMASELTGVLSVYLYMVQSGYIERRLKSSLGATGVFRRRLNSSRGETSRDRSTPPSPSEANSCATYRRVTETLKGTRRPKTTSDEGLTLSLISKRNGGRAPLRSARNNTSEQRKIKRVAVAQRRTTVV